MSASTASGRTSAGMLDQLNKASSAEDFFALLDVQYDVKVVNVARLHILRRMAQYLANEDFAGLSEAVVGERCKQVLERAYSDFVVSTPIDERVFKVHRDAVAAATPKTPSLVQLSALK